MTEQNDTTIGGNGSNSAISVVDLMDLEIGSGSAKVEETPVAVTELPADAGSGSPEAPDDTPVVEATPEMPGDFPISATCIYKVTRRGITILRNPNSIRTYTRKMQESQINDFIVFADAAPSLIFIENDTGVIGQLCSPPKIKTTSTRLYAMAVTYRSTITRWVRRHLRKNQDAMARASKLFWIIALSVITLSVIFMLGVVAMDSGGSDTGSEAASPGVELNPSGEQPNLNITPTPTQNVTKQNDNRVYVPPAGENP